MKDNRLVIHNITSVYLSIYRRLKAKTHFYVVNYFLYILYLAYKTKWIHVKWCVQFCESFFCYPCTRISYNNLHFSSWYRVHCLNGKVSRWHRYQVWGIFYFIFPLNVLNVRNRYMSAVFVLNTLISSVSPQTYKHSMGWFAHLFKCTCRSTVSNRNFVEICT